MIPALTAVSCAGSGASSSPRCRRASRGSRPQRPASASAGILRYGARMTDDPPPLLEAAFEEADKLVRQRLRNKVETEPYYLMLALGPDGAAIIRTLSRMCAEIANQVEAGRTGRTH